MKKHFSIFILFTILLFKTSFSREINIEQIAYSRIWNSTPLWSKLRLDSKNRMLVNNLFFGQVLDYQLNIWTTMLPSKDYRCLVSEFLKGDNPKIILGSRGNLYIYDWIGNFIKEIKTGNALVVKLMQLTENTISGLLGFKKLIICNVDTNEVIQKELDSIVRFMLVDSKHVEKNIIVALSDGQIQWWSTEGKLLKNIKLDQNFFTYFMLSFDNLLFVASTTLNWIDGRLQVFDLDTGEELPQFNFDKFVTYLAKSKNHSKLVSSSGALGGMICIWDVKSRALINSFSIGSDERIQLTEFVPDSNLLISLIVGDEPDESKIVLWDENGNRIFSLNVDFDFWNPSIKFIKSKNIFFIKDVTFAATFKINGI